MGKKVLLMKDFQQLSCRLGESLQKGPIRFGFYRTGKPLSRCIAFAPFRYWFIVFCNRVSRRNLHLCKLPLPTVVQNIYKEFEKCQNFDVTDPNMFRREFRDMKELYHAMMESASATNIFLVAFNSFCLSIIFLFFALIKLAFINADEEKEMNMNTDNEYGYARFTLQSLSTINSFFGAIIAIELFAKLYRHQRKVGKSIDQIPLLLVQESDKKRSICQALSRIASIQSIVSLMWVFASLGTLITLAAGLIIITEPCVLVVTNMCSNDKAALVKFVSRNIWFAQRTAVGSITFWVLGRIGIAYVNFFLLWKLDPDSSSILCDYFRGQLAHHYKNYAVKDEMNRRLYSKEQDGNNFVQKDYMCREFLNRTRFDSVLGADRVSAIIQTVLDRDFHLDEESNSSGENTV